MFQRVEQKLIAFITAGIYTVLAPPVDAHGVDAESAGEGRQGWSIGLTTSGGLVAWLGSSTTPPICPFNHIAPCRLFSFMHGVGSPSVS